MRSATRSLVLAIALALAAVPAAAQQSDWVEGDSPLPEVTQRGDVPPFQVNATAEDGAVVLTWQPVDAAARYDAWVSAGPFPAENEDDWRAVDADVRTEDDGTLRLVDTSPPAPEGQAEAIVYVVIGYGFDDHVAAQGRIQVDPDLVEPGIFDEPEDFPQGDEEVEAEGTTGSLVPMLIILVAVAVIGGAAYVLVQAGRK